MPESIYNFSVQSNNNENICLNIYKGKVCLIVNTASACGFTTQYSGLEALYKKYKHLGLEVLAFPCNQFGQQEKGNNAEIKHFCDINYNISFPLFSKVEVNGKNALPLYNYLKKSARGLLGTQSIKWNFTKFLVDEEGIVIKRFSPNTKPVAIEQAIEKLFVK